MGAGPLAIEDEFYDALAGAARASLLASAVELGLDRLLATHGPLPEDEVVSRLGLDAGRGRKWIALLRSAGLVAVEEGRVVAGGLLVALAEHLGPAGYFYREFLRYWRIATAPDMALVVRGAAVPQHVRYPPAVPEDTRLLHDWMRSGALLTLREIESRFDFSGVARMLDVGGGDATMACELVRRFPLHATVFNVPQAAALARANVTATSLGSRVAVVEGDFRTDELPGGFDLVLFSRVLADWDPATCRKLLARAWRALVPGGSLVVAEPFRDDNPALALAWEHSYLPYDDFGAETYKPSAWYREAAAEAGFASIRSFPRSRDSIHGVLVATRPSG